MPDFPDYSREYSRRFGPFGPSSEGAEAENVIVIRDPYIPSENDKVVGKGGILPYRAILSSPSTQVIQILPNRFYDAFTVAIRDPLGTSGNRVFGRWENLLGTNGIGTHPAGSIPANIPPDFTSELFTDLTFFRVDFPYGTQPFWINLRGSLGNAYQVSIVLFDSGY